MTTPDHHTSQLALDVYGTYRGTLPCADCEGIKTTVVLNTDNTFTLQQDYLGKPESKMESSGKFFWNKDGNAIILKNTQDETQFFVGENTLTQLDKSGKKIEGTLAQNYVFTKDNYEILGKTWTLVELLGKPVEPSETIKKDAYITFDDQTNRYNASAGCNSISGNFKVLAFNKLELKAGMSTMMACPDMTLETQLNDVLKRADSFIINGDELTLVKGRMAPLAKFKTALRR